jgi:primary-amine oxidase
VQNQWTDMSQVLVEVWTYGKALMPERYRDRRLGWCDVWYRAAPDGNPYAHPVSGLKVGVDMNTLELLEIENDHDHGQPDIGGEYCPARGPAANALTSPRCRSLSPRARRSPSTAPS